MSKIQVRLNPDVTPSGSDLAVVNAARRSFSTRSEWEYEMYDLPMSRRQTYAPQGCRRILKDKDKRLIQFLARGMTADDFEQFVYESGQDYWDYIHDTKGGKENVIEKLWEWRNTPIHDTPFNHCFLSFEVKAPIFVARQLVKHEYLIMSEFSRRYITDDIDFYEPDYWRKAAPNKKQGSLEESVDVGLVPHTAEGQALITYRHMIDRGVAPEQARMVLPQSTMTEWTWSGTLGAFAKMCQLRLHPEAQYEARLVAKEIYKHLIEYYPVSAKALVEGADV